MASFCKLQKEQKCWPIVTEQNAKKGMRTCPSYNKLMFTVLPALRIISMRTFRHVFFENLTFSAGRIEGTIFRWQICWPPQPTDFRIA